MTLKKSKIVVVGGSSGIGYGAAEALLKEGASVTIVGRSSEKLETAKKQLAGGEQLKIHATDVTKEDQVEQLFAEVGPFDHLIVTRGAPPINSTMSSFDLNNVRSFIDLMVVSAVSLTKHATANISKEGSITFTSGISKDKPGPGGSVVAAVAGSMTYLTRSLALELAPVRVNVVSPGWVETPMWDDIVGPAKTQIWQDMGTRLPVGRVAKPADIALAYLFILNSAMMTGEVLHIDGGHRLI